MHEEPQTRLMHQFTLRKGQRLAHKASQALTQGQVPALDMVGLARAFSNWVMLIVGQDGLVALPKIAIQQAMPVRERDTTPEQAAGGLAAVTDGIGDDLARATAQRQPDPTFILFRAYERPQFIQLQDLGLIHGRWHQRLFQRRQLLGFF